MNKNKSDFMCPACTSSKNAKFLGKIPSKFNIWGVVLTNGLMGMVVQYALRPIGKGREIIQHLFVAFDVEVSIILRVSGL